MIRKVLRKIGLVLLYIVTGILILYFIILLLVHLPPIQNNILARLEKQVNTNIQGKIYIESFRTNLINSVTFFGVTATSTVDDQDSLNLKRLVFNYYLPALINKKILINKIIAQNGRVYIYRNKRGNIQFPLLQKPTTDSVAQSKPSPWKLELDSGMIKNIDITYCDRKLNVYSVLNSTKGEIDFNDFDSLKTWVSTNKTIIESPWWNGTLDSLYLNGRRDDSIAILEKFLVSGNQARLSANGSIPLSTDAKFNLNGTFAAELEPFSNSLLSAQDTLRGSFSGTIQAEGTLQKPTLTTIIKSPYLQYNKYIIDSAYVKAQYTESESLQIVSFMHSLYGTVKINTLLGIPDLLVSPHIDGYQANVSADITNIDAVLQEFNVNNISINGYAKMDLFATGDSLTKIPDSANVIFALKETGSSPLDTARAHLILTNSKWKLEALLGKGNQIAGSGIIRIPKVLNGKIRGNISNPRVLSSFFLKHPVTGSFSFQTSFQNVIQNPKLQTQVQSNFIAWKGISAEQLKAVIRYDNKWYIENSHAYLKANLDQVTIPDFEIKGQLIAEISAEGVLPIPKIEAVAVITDPVFQNYSADRIAAQLLYTNQTVYWDSLLILRDSLQLTSYGNLDFLAPHRFIKSALTLRVNEVPVANLKAKGSLVGDSLNAFTEIDYLIPGRFISGFPFYPCYEGTARVQAIVDNRYCIQSGIMNLDLIQYAPTLVKPYFINGALEYYTKKISGKVKIRTNNDSIPALEAVVGLKMKRMCLGPQLQFENNSTIQFVAKDLEYGQLVQAFIPKFKTRGSLDGDIKLVFENDDWKIDGSVNASADTLSYNPIKFSANNLHIILQPEGTIKSPLGKFTITGRQIEYRNEPILNAMAQGTIDTNMVIIDTLFGSFNKGGFITASGIIPYKRGTPSGPNARFEFSLNKMPLTLANPFLPEAFITSGNLTGNGQLNFGKEINAKGHFDLSDAQFTSNLCEETFGPISAEISLVHDSIILENLKGTIGNGTIDGKGFVQLGIQDVRDFKINLRIQDARFECENLSQLGIDNATISFNKQKEGYLLTTAISINETRVDRVINIPGIVGGMIGRQPRGIVPEILQKTAVEATLELNRNLLINTNIGRLLLDGQMTVRGTLAQPQFKGILKVVEGRIQYLDREFELEEGTLRQYDPFEINPDIDISATTQVRDLTLADPIEYTISIAIRGTLKEPEVTITSSPPLEEPEIVNLLTLGTTEGTLQERTGEIISSQITGLGSQILEQSLGISNISITGNIFSIPENGGLTLTLRQNITSNLSVAYQTDITNPSTQGFLISYRLFPHFRVIGQTQTDGVSDIGFRYIIRR